MNGANLLIRLQPMPILRMVVPFGAGILFAEYFTLPAWFVLGTFVLAGVLGLLLRSWLYTLVALFVFGIACAQIRTNSGSPPANLFTSFDVVIDAIPADRGAYSTTSATALAWREPSGGVWHSARHKIVLRADSTITLSPGERLTIQARLHPFSDSSSYERLMLRRGYLGRVWLSSRNLIERSAGRYSNLQMVAVERLQRMGLADGQQGVCHAMAAGDRSGISSQIRSDYARSGFSHLLAVSGLHVAIVFGLINLLLWWLPLLRRGHLIGNVVATLAIWLFVAAAGFAPSAVRAAVMFTCLQFALARASVYVAGNVLAAAAFAMLLYNPDYLHDISFQLSFIAVAAILAWGVPLCRLCKTRWRGVNWLLSGFIISAVSSLATAPLVSYSFGIIPIFGLILSPFAILLAVVIVVGGVIWMLLPIPLLAPIFGFGVGWAVKTLNSMAQICAANPHSALDYSLSEWQTWLAYLILVLLTALWGCRETKKIVHLPS